VGRGVERFDPTGDSVVQIGDNTAAVAVDLVIGMREITDGRNH
jgi:hypothetical protein